MKIISTTLGHDINRRKIRAHADSVKNSVTHSVATGGRPTQIHPMTSGSGSPVPAKSGLGPNRLRLSMFSFSLQAGM